LIDYSRRKTAGRRGGGAIDISLEDTINLSWLKENKSFSAEDMIIVHELLDRLEEKHERASRVLYLKYFLQMTDHEVAESMNISVPTVRRDLIFAKAWVRREVDRKPPGTDL